MQTFGIAAKQIHSLSGLFALANLKLEIKEGLSLFHLSREGRLFVALAKQLFILFPSPKDLLTFLRFALVRLALVVRFALLRFLWSAMVLWEIPGPFLGALVDPATGLIASHKRQGSVPPYNLLYLPCIRPPLTFYHHLVSSPSMLPDRGPSMAPPGLPSPSMPGLPSSFMLGLIS